MTVKTSKSYQNIDFLLIYTSGKLAKRTKTYEFSLVRFSKFFLPIRRKLKCFGLNDEPASVFTPFQTMSTIAIFARQSLAQFCIIYDEITTDGHFVPAHELESLMWSRICAKEAGIEKQPFKTPIDNIKKTKIQLPYLPDDIKYTGCPAIKKNGGLYTPCCGKVKTGEEVCMPCGKAELKFGNIETRSENIENDLFSPISYGEWMKAHKTDLSEVYATLSEGGISIEIPARELQVRELPKKTRRGRPGKSNDSVIEDEDSVPKKGKKSKKSEDSDFEEPKEKKHKKKSISAESDSEVEPPKKVKAKKTKSEDSEAESESETKTKPKEKKVKAKKTKSEDSEAESESETKTKPKKVIAKKTKSEDSAAESESETKTKPKKSKKESKSEDSEAETNAKAKKEKKEKKSKSEDSEAESDDSKMSKKSKKSESESESSKKKVKKVAEPEVDVEVVMAVEVPKKKKEKKDKAVSEKKDKSKSKDAEAKAVAKSESDMFEDGEINENELEYEAPEAEFEDEEEQITIDGKTIIRRGKLLLDEDGTIVGKVDDDGELVIS